MQKIKALFTVMLFLMLHVVFGQGVIRGVTPARGLAGQELQLSFFGMSTDFRPGEVIVYPADGMRLIEVQVRNSRILLIRVYIEPNSEPGYRDFRIVSNGLLLDALKLFEVLPANTPLSQIQWNSFENIDAADFQPQGPLLFNLELSGFKNLSQHHMELVLTNAKNKQLLAGQYTFPQHITALPSNKIFEQINLTSQSFPDDDPHLPNGFYQLELRIKTPDGQMIFRESHTAFFVRGCTEIGGGQPGTPMNTGQPPVNFYAFPTLFSWNHDAERYAFALYKLEDHFNSISDIKSSFPLFQTQGITEGHFTYPRHAPALEYGQVYAWQVRGTTSNLPDAIAVESPLFWFTYKIDNPQDFVKQPFTITPEQTDIYCGGTFQFDVSAKDSTGLPINIRPEWKVMPEGLGKIDGFGNFTAGPKPGYGAVVATYAGKQDMSLIQVVAYAEKECTIKIVEGIFGPNSVRTNKKLAP